MATQHILLPAGTTAERPASPAVGMIRYNTSLVQYEYYGSNGWNGMNQDLTPFTQINTTSMTHNIVNAGSGGLQISGGSQISAYGSAAPSVSGYQGSGAFSTHGGHGGSGNFPMYWAVYLGSRKAVNKLVCSLHGNSWGYFELAGSNDCGNGSNFATNGTWINLTFSSSNNGSNNQNMGGGSSGYGDGAELTFNYSNNTGYLAYRIKILDSSRANQAQGSLYNGSAGYFWRLDRV